MQFNGTGIQPLVDGVDLWFVQAKCLCRYSAEHGWAFASCPVICHPGPNRHYSSCVNYLAHSQAEMGSASVKSAGQLWYKYARSLSFFFLDSKVKRVKKAYSDHLTTSNSARKDDAYDGSSISVQREWMKWQLIYTCFLYINPPWPSILFVEKN